MISSNIEIESLVGLNQIETYNIFLNRVMECLSILEEER